MTALIASTTTTNTDSLADYLATTAIEICERAKSNGDPETVLLAADRVARALAGLQARWLTIAEQTGVVRRSGARNPGAWLEALTGEAGRDAHAKAGVADAAAKTPSIGAGLLDGSLNDAQAKQIAKTADATKASPERVEEFIEDVKGLSAKETARKARELEREYSTETPTERLEQQRRKRGAFMDTKTDGSGMFELHAQFDPITGERIRLELIRAFKSLHEGDNEKRSYKQILADALEHLITCGSGSESGAGTAGPAGGVDLMVTVTLEDLIAGLNATGKLVGTAETIPVTEIRRIACEQGIIPTLLGTQGEVLDMGRRTRLATPAQKRALKATYGGCCVPGCDVPFEFCEIHHIWYWTKGGPTDLAYLVPVCNHDHHLIHDQGWTLTKHQNATTSFDPP